MPWEPSVNKHKDTCPRRHRPGLRHARFGRLPQRRRRPPRYIFGVYCIYIYIYIQMYIFVHGFVCIYRLADYRLCVYKGWTNPLVARCAGVWGCLSTWARPTTPTCARLPTVAAPPPPVLLYFRLPSVRHQSCPTCFGVWGSGLIEGYLEKGIQTPMAQGRST